MKNAKGMSPAMWVIISVVVALVVALIVITVVNSSSNKAGKNAGSSMEASQTGIDAATCQTLCNNCKMIYGSTDCGTKWTNSGLYSKCSQVQPPATIAILATCT